MSLFSKKGRNIRRREMLCNECFNAQVLKAKGVLYCGSPAFARVVPDMNENAYTGDVTHFVPTCESVRFDINPHAEDCPEWEGMVA